MIPAGHLSIYKASYDLCLYLGQVVRGFAHYLKYTLGSDLRGDARREKAPVVLEVRDGLSAFCP